MKTALRAGVLAGPLFVLLALAQMAVRDGFDPMRHPVSLLANGDGGWVQVFNFVATGLLIAAFAAGLRQRLRPGPGAVWAPVLFAVCGAGLVVGGVFRADPALGFPVGTPEGTPSSISLTGTIHAIAPPLAFTALVVGIVLAGRRLVNDGHGRAAVIAWIVAGATFALSLPVWPSLVTIFVAIVVGFGWLAWYATRLLAVSVHDPVHVGAATARI
jgi:hypothetical protein